MAFYHSIKMNSPSKPWVPLRDYLDQYPDNHTCLEWGQWCWKQALQRPDKALKYLRNKL
jgi:hypothetical protein